MIVNPFDLLVAMIFLVGLFYGVFNDAFKQMFGLVKTWLGLIVALWLYNPFSEHILQGIWPDTAPIILDCFALLLLILAYGVLWQIGAAFRAEIHAYRRTSYVPIIQKMNTLDQEDHFEKTMKVAGGMLMSLVSTTIWISLGTVAMRQLLVLIPLGSSVQQHVDTAAVTPYVYEIVLLIYSSVALFVPGYVGDLLYRLV